MDHPLVDLVQIDVASLRRSREEDIIDFRACTGFPALAGLIGCAARGL